MRRSAFAALIALALAVAAFAGHGLAAAGQQRQVEVVKASWTDPDGVEHTWRIPCNAGGPIGCERLYEHASTSLSPTAITLSAPGLELSLEPGSAAYHELLPLLSAGAPAQLARRLIRAA